tara:strand:- start:3394 stop:3813 length:420 start_codon:yes stop_codon:yes gene_type:complete
MASVTLKGNAIHTLGSLPATGEKAPEFQLTKNDLSILKLSDYEGSRVVLNIFPSVDTGTCAQARFCGAEGIENVEMLSDFRDGNFGKSYYVDFSDGPLAPLHSRAIVVVDEKGKVLYTEQVAEITEEPNYKAALEALMN